MKLHQFAFCWFLNLPLHTLTFTTVPSKTQRPSTTSLFDLRLPANEFSRPLQTDRILKTSGGNRRRSRKDYLISLEATPEECKSLEERFELKGLTSLTADLAIRPAEEFASHRGGILTVQVEGTVQGHLTRTCVRSNEDFEADLEIPILTVIKPTTLQAMEQDVELFEQINKKKKREPIKANGLGSMNDMIELQSMLDKMEIEDEDVWEDESIYSLSTGQLDVGELVAQSFWLGLDPYPKKPGSGPVEFEISG